MELDLYKVIYLQKNYGANSVNSSELIKFIHIAILAFFFFGKIS